MITTPRFTFAALPKLAVVLLIALACFAASSTAYAKRTKPARVGTVKITTPSGQYQVFIDGAPSGLTHPLEKDGKVLDPVPQLGPIELTPGSHTIEVELPDGKRWTRVIDVQRARAYCIGVNYIARALPLCTDYPSPVVSISQTDKEGDTLSYHANVAYDAPPTFDYRLRYYWTVTPGTVITTGGNDSPDIRINTAAAGGPVNVHLKVEVEDASGTPGCRGEAEVGIACTPVTAVILPPNPSSYRGGDQVTFKARPDYAGEMNKLHYAWTVTAEGTNLDFTGDGTDTITVDTGKLRGVSPDKLPTITALLKVDDGSSGLGCPPAEATASVNCGFDCSPVTKLNDLKARLDNFVIALQDKPGSTGQVYIYGPLRQAQSVSNQARDYMVNTRHIDANRISVKPVGVGDKVHIELFIVELGQKPIPQQQTPMEQPAGIQHIPGYRHRTSRPRGRKN
jgi:hypothetical protein